MVIDYCKNCIKNANSLVRKRQDEDSQRRAGAREAQENRVVECGKCRMQMVKGFLVESNAPLQLLTIGEGLYWSSSESGFIGDRIALTAYACPSCGYVETYIRRIEEIKLG